MTIKCQKCLHKNPDDTIYCGKCGAKLQAHEDISVTHTKTLKVTSPSKNIAGRYKIQAEVGRGGMGVVYKAKDTRLDRIVALKFLPPELTRDEEARKRFIQEAKAAAALNHPHICTIYEIDEADLQTFISMEYIEGQSLKGKLKEGPFDIDEAKEIALQVAEGLKEAHEKGIVHRDVKPANIMLTEKGQAKITDFGLAKLSWGKDLTKPSIIMGTVAYMSPEQARGEKVDHRTDIWSLSVMLYEMLTGEHPFKKSHEQALIYSILNDKEEPISSIRPDVPGYITKTVHKALAKNVDQRYSEINSLIQDLKPTLSIDLPKPSCSIVVLPFDDMSPDRDNEYFSDGLTEEIITDLSKVQELCVISRSSTMTFKGTTKSIPEIARAVNVRYVLEGSVRKAGINLRITAQLIDAKTDIHLWAEKYSGTLDDVFDIQEKVSRSIVDALKIKLSPKENQNIAERPIENVLAYEYYLKAKHEIMSFTKEGFDRAMEYLQNGLKILGENALMLRGMGLARFQQLNIGVSSDRTVIIEIEDYARRILEWDSESPHGYLLNGFVEVLRGNFLEAVKQWHRAYRLDPNDPETMVFLGAHSLSTGQPEFSRKLFDKLVTIDPLNPINHMLISYADFYMGRPADNLDSLRRAVKTGSDIPILMWGAVRIFAAAGEMDEASIVAEQLNNAHPKATFSRSANALILTLNGQKENALNQIKNDVYELAMHDCEWATGLIECYAVSGENKKALDLLEHSIDGGLINYPFLNEYDPFLENIRNETRFRKLMERVKHEWENFEV